MFVLAGEPDRAREGGRYAELKAYYPDGKLRRMTCRIASGCFVICWKRQVAHHKRPCWCSLRRSLLLCSEFSISSWNTADQFIGTSHDYVRAAANSGNLTESEEAD